MARDNSTAYVDTVQVAGQILLDICMKASGLMSKGLIEARRLEHDGEEQASLKYSVYLSEVIWSNRPSSCHMKS
jgi:hypothetical protein